MTRNCIRALALCLAVPPSATAQPTPGFDCAKATTALDRLICSDQDLAALDRTLTGRYTQLRDHLSPEGLAALRDSQRKWLAARNECMTGDTAALCLGSRYTDRTNDLAVEYKTAGTLSIENHEIDRRIPRRRVAESDSFPWMLGTPQPRAAAFNRYIAQRLNLAKSMFAASAIKLDMPPQGDTTFSRTYEIHRFDDRLISLKFFQFHESYFGHGWRSEYAITWDLQRDRPLRIADLFRADRASQQAIYDLAMQHIHADGDFQDPESAFAPSAIDDDEAWLFDADGAVLLLGHGERSMVGASVDVAMPYDELQPFLRPDAPIAGH